MQVSAHRSMVANATLGDHQQGQSATDLFTLPPEIRLTIYEYALTDFTPASTPNERLATPKPLLHICRLIRYEAHVVVAKPVQAAVKDARDAYEAAKTLPEDKTHLGPLGTLDALRGYYRKVYGLKKRVMVLEQLAWCLRVEV